MSEFVKAIGARVAAQIIFAAVVILILIGAVWYFRLELCKVALGTSGGEAEFCVPQAQSTAAPTEPVQQVVVVVTATSPVIQPTTTDSLQTPPTSAPILPTATQAPFVTIFQVIANLSWQDTGVQISTGDRLRIIWDGISKWRGTNFGDFSDPLGGYVDTSNPQYACPPLMPPEEAGWNALVAKISDNGVVTNPFKAIPTGEGKLYLAMNDCDKERYDNEGSVTVTIEVRH
jgi:hypothetical protein